MPDQLQLRGGTTTEHNSFTGALREVTVDTTKKTLVVHDGATAGGTALMRESGGNAASTVGIGVGGANKITINADGHVDIASNLDCAAGIDVTGNITSTGTITSNDITIQDQQPRLNFVDNAGSPDDPDYLFQVDGGHFVLHDSTNGVNKIKVNSDGHVDIIPNCDFEAGIDVTGAITGTGDLTIDTNTLHVDSSNNRVGIGTTSPTSTLFVSGTSSSHIFTARSADTNGNCIINLLSEGTTGNSRILFSDTAHSDGIITFSHNDRALIFGTVGTAEDMRLDSSGRLLVGTTTEGHDNADDLTIATSGQTGITIRSASNQGGNIYFSDATSGDAEFDGFISYSQNVNEMFFGTNQNTRMTIDSSGDVDILGGQLRIDGSVGDTIIKSSGAEIEFTRAASSNITCSNASGSLKIKTGGNDSMLINSSGTLFIGKSSQSSSTAGVELYQDGPNFMTRTAVNVLGLNVQGNSTGDSMRFYFQDVHRGSLNYNGSTFAATTASDYRLKENDTPITDGIERIKRLRPIKFNWKKDSSTTHDGFIAHELQAVMPDCVFGEKDAEISEKGEGYQHISKEGLIPLLTAALKEEIAKREALEARIAALEGS